ncbi:MAG: alpha-galactosidase [Lachnospiraceae bacterium]|nr:alpha-galactosidase [Lachnospiraceae bacterium]
MITPRLSFLWNGADFREADPEITESGTSVRYRLPDGVEIETRIERFDAYGVIRWTNYWSNPTDRKSGLISGLYDCDILLPAGGEKLKIIGSKGSVSAFDDYRIEEHLPDENGRYETSCTDGRSADGVLPFFDLNLGEEGAILAVGWSGQWNAVFDRTEEGVRIRTGLPEASFRMLPGEKFRTGSVTLMRYSDGVTRAHNVWRRFMKNEVSPIGRFHGQRGTNAPFSAIFWGGVTSEALLRRWNAIFENRLPFESCWIDAGWYEPLRGTTMKEQFAEWANSGTWEINRFYHPKAYRDVVDTLHAHGVKMLVWMEPERIRTKVAPWTESTELPGRVEALTALHRENVLNDVIGAVTRNIDAMSLDVYRQDFNVPPLEYWRKADREQPDGEERRGTTEIRHVNNLYRFWDVLLEKYPHLLIDNCSSGGRRNDVELLSRSVPMWRSDYQCAWDCPPEGNQIQTAGFSFWYPYSGVGYGPTLGDVYSFRSAYSNGLTVRTWEHADPDWEVGARGEPLDWARTYFAEFLEVRHYFAEDYYPLVPFSAENDVWSVSQYHDPAQNAGIVLAFRRPDSGEEEMLLPLSGLDRDAEYSVENRDTGERFTLSGALLSDEGLRLRIGNPRESRLILYKKA